MGLHWFLSCIPILCLWYRPVLQHTLCSFHLHLIIRPPPPPPNRQKTAGVRRLSIQGLRSVQCVQKQLELAVVKDKEAK
jgi:hypothetical protein